MTIGRIVSDVGTLFLVCKLVLVMNIAKTLLTSHERTINEKPTSLGYIHDGYMCLIFFVIIEIEKKG